MLLAASLYFYMCWKVEYVVLIIASTLIDYLAGLGMGRWTTKPTRVALLVLCLITNLVVNKI